MARGKTKVVNSFVKGGRIKETFRGSKMGKRKGLRGK